jgi:hypothetical protein
VRLRVHSMIVHPLLERLYPCPAASSMSRYLAAVPWSARSGSGLLTMKGIAA